MSVQRSFTSSDDCKLSESFNSPHAPLSDWSARIADRYRCSLSPLLADWFDSELWRSFGRGEYREPVSPESLLTPAPELVWPGLMCCDLLPLIGNTAGDWLCVRVDQDNVMSEIVQWYHGGGDWIPWGKDLAQAIIFDAAIDLIPGATRRHAIPAEDPRPVTDSSAQQIDPLLRWALTHQAGDLVTLFDGHHRQSHQVAQTLLEFQIAEVAVRCELVVSLLTHWSRELLNSVIRVDDATDRAHLAKWSFDVEQVPEEIRQRLRELSGITASQDWDAAADHARKVCQLCPDVAWAWEIVGYAAERRGDLSVAIDAYRQGATCSVFTDQSIRLDTHWLAHESAKFSVARLARLCPEAVDASSYYQILCLPDARQRRRQATAYWTQQAAQHAEKGDHSKAHGCYVAAAWDLGADLISSYGSLLDQITESAQLAGQFGRAEVARTHRRCLRERYGV